MQTGKFRDGAAWNGQRCPFFRKCATFEKTGLSRSALQDFVQGISETLNGCFRPIAVARLATAYSGFSSENRLFLYKT